MASIIFNVILEVLGIIAIAAGLVGGITTMFKEIQKKVDEGKGFGLIQLPTEFIKALTALLEALMKAPVWLALVILGILLVLVSNWL
jgi:hypothetical protein